MLSFQFIVCPSSEQIHTDKGLMSEVESLYSGQITLANFLIKSNINFIGLHFGFNSILDF